MHYIYVSSRWIQSRLEMVLNIPYLSDYEWMSLFFFLPFFNISCMWRNVDHSMSHSHSQSCCVMDFLCLIDYLWINFHHRWVSVGTTQQHIIVQSCYSTGWGSIYNKTTHSSSIPLYRLLRCKLTSARMKAIISIFSAHTNNECVWSIFHCITKMWWWLKLCGHGNKE